MPLETQQVYETKGRLLAKIEELNKVAKIAFWGQTEIASQFNKDILNRARNLCAMLPRMVPNESIARRACEAS